MSVQLNSASGGNDASLQGTTVGGSKPLHRFMKGQPKIVGVIVLALGVSFFIVSISVRANIMFHYIWSAISPGLLMETLFLISGILFIVTEHKPTKRTSMGLCLEAIFLFYTLVAIVIFITMSSLAGTALRSTKSQVVVVMTTMPTETLVE